MNLKEKFHRTENSEIDFAPFMNLMVVLIPILLISAEFARISIIDINLPENRGVNTTKRQDKPTPEDMSNKLILTAIVTDSIITIGSKSGFLPSIRYREFHEYIAKNDRRHFTIEHTPGKQVLHPLSKRQMKENERYEIHLYATNENNKIIKAFYNKNNELVTDIAGNPVADLLIGDTLFTLSIPRKVIVVSNKADFHKKQLSAYDVLKSKLLAVKEKYPNVEDSDKIIIAAENTVLYDKIIKIMDVAREINFPDIGISKLRQS